MPVEIGEMTFLGQLADHFNIPAPEYLTSEASRSDIKTALSRWGGKGVVKPDILSGKRGKAGLISVVTNAQDAIKKLRTVAAAEIGGRNARTAYLVQYIPCEHELYTAITYDSRWLGPAFTISLAGGVDVEQIGQENKKTIEVDVFEGLDAYQASDMLESLHCPKPLISPLSRTFVNFWDMFITAGMRMAEINPWRITPDGKVYACDFKGIFDDANYRFGEYGQNLPEYPQAKTEFEEEMAEWDAASHRGQAHVADLDGKRVLPILFGGGAGTIIIETLLEYGGEPMFLSDFGGNPPYERMYGTVERCLRHKLRDASLLLILGGRANNTLIDVTFQAIADALRNYFEHHGPVDIPVVVGRGGPRLVQGFLVLRKTLDDLRLPYVMFGPDTPITLVAEYAAKLARNTERLGENDQ